MEEKALKDLLKNRSAREWEHVMIDIMNWMAYAQDILPNGGIHDTIKDVIELQRFFIEIQDNGQIK